MSRQILPSGSSGDDLPSANSGKGGGDLKEEFHIFEDHILFHIFLLFDPIFYHAPDHFRPCRKIVFFFPKIIYLFYDFVVKPQHNWAGIDGRATFFYHFAIVPRIRS